MSVQEALKRQTVLFGAVALALVGLVGWGPPVMAQDQDEPPAEGEQAEETAAAEGQELEVITDMVTTTGSLIPRPTLEAMSPVSTLEPEEITYSGVTRIEDLVAQMPQVFQAQNSTISNGASGTATVALRHLGAERTLVLINGRRTAPGDAFEIAPDLNFIPAQLVKRVDILTGGASSAYGADAVAGVVNFVLDTDFTGVRGTITHAGYHHENNNSVAREINTASGFEAPTGSIFDGQTSSVSLVVGGKFAEGKGHASAYFEYRDIESLTKSERDYTNCSNQATENGPACTGSSTTPRGRFILFDQDFNFVEDLVLTLQGEGGDGHSFRTRTGEVFNFGPFNHMQRPDEKYAAGGFANYKINEHFDVYGQVMFMDDYSEAQIAPTGNFGRTSTINCNNPLLSDQQRDRICTSLGLGPDDITNVLMLRRNIEGPGRNNVFRHTSWRLLTGVRGDINDSWSYDVYGMYAEVLSPQEYENDFHISRIGEALNVIADPVTGEPVCASGNPDCVPWNVFQEGGVTQEALNFLYVNPVLTSGVSSKMFNATFYGDLESWGWKLPGATEGIQLALGHEMRTENLYVHPDETQETGQIAGFGGATVRIQDGEYDVKDLFVEALVPVIQDKPGIQDLTFEFGYRLSDYNVSGSHDNYKAMVAYAPNLSLKFRTGINRATRAANVRELFSPQRFGLGGSEDICAGPTPSATFEQCARTGVTETQYGNILANPAGQYNTLIGGNPALRPEVADTFTAGVVWTPQNIPGLSLAIDYYDIEITETIGSLGANDIIQTCANTGDPGLCSLINRDRAGTLWLTEDAFTETTQQNIGQLFGEGVDVSFAWLKGLGNKGFLNMSLLGSYMLTDRFANPLIDYDCVGFYGNQCGIPDAKWRHRARISWETNFDTVFTLGWRHAQPVLIDDASPDPDLANPGLIPAWQASGSFRNPAFNWFDLAVSWNMSDNYQLVVGVNNVLDKEPPLCAGVDDCDFGPGHFGYYDPYGRYVHSSIHFSF